MNLSLKRAAFLRNALFILGSCLRRNDEPGGGEGGKKSQRGHSQQPQIRHSCANKNPGLIFIPKEYILFVTCKIGTVSKFIKSGAIQKEGIFIGEGYRAILSRYGLILHKIYLKFSLLGFLLLTKELGNEKKFYGFYGKWYVYWGCSS